MVRKDDILGRVRVAAPCSQSWEWMEGDDRQRHCSACKLNVYNLSGMTRKEAETLVSSAEGRLCIRYYQRRDGTIITQDCPVGIRAIRKRVATAASCALVMFSSLYAFAARAANMNPEEAEQYTFQNIKDRVRQSEPIRTIVNYLDPPPPIQGKMMMGAIAAPSTASPRSPAPKGS
jgi:hypothetical protein